MLPSVLFAILARPTAPESLLLTRRGARSVSVRYELAISIRFSGGESGLRATIEEQPIDLQTARVSIRKVQVLRGRPPWKDVADDPRRVLTMPFLSAQNLLGLSATSAQAGEVLEVQGDPLDALATSLPLEAVAPLGGRLSVVGYVGGRTTLRGTLEYLVLNARRTFETEAQFDPYSGRPVRFTMRTTPQTRATATRPDIELSLKAAAIEASSGSG